MDDPPPCSLSHCLGSSLNPQFVEAMDDVGLYRAFADEGFICDLFICGAVLDKLEHLGLPKGENFLEGRSLGELAEAVDPPAGHPRLDQGLPTTAKFDS